MALDRVAAESAFLHLLVEQLRPSAPDGHLALVRLLDHIAGMVGGHAAVITPDTRVIGRDDASSSLLRAHGSATAKRVREGALGAACLVLPGSYVQIVGIGNLRPRPVILVAGRAQYPRWVADLVNYAALALGASSTPSRLARGEHELVPAVHTARAAILTHLMAGDVTAARRLARPVLPGVLDTSPTRVFLVECPPGSRTLSLESCRRALAGAALAAADPHCPDHVVVVAPPPRSPHTDKVRRALKELVEARSVGAVGESGPVELDRFRDAYDMAARALRVARRRPERIALHSDGKQLAQHLPDSARGWAQAYLTPFQELSDEERFDLLSIVGEVLHTGHAAAAEKISLNRKTVAARWNRAGSVLGVDLRDMRVRAELNLALELAQTQSQSAPGGTREPALSLAEILHSPAALAWAQEFTAPLRRDARPLLRTVTAWIAANGRIEECAQHLDAHPNTVRNHLAACERLLGRRLVGRSGGAHDLVIALRIQSAARRER